MVCFAPITHEKMKNALHFARALLTIADNVQIVRDLLVVDNYSNHFT